MSKCEREIEKAVKVLGLSEAQFAKCPPAKSSEIVHNAQIRFVVDNPRVWWLGFRQPYVTHAYSDPRDWEQRLMATIPDDTKRCWLIVESDDDTYPVYDVQTDAIVAVLKECSFFEYYLVDPDLNWIVADTDHNQLILAQRIGAQKGESAN